MQWRSCVIKDMKIVTEESAGNYINSRYRTICEILHTSVERCLLKYPPKRNLEINLGGTKSVLKPEDVTIYSTIYGRKLDVPPLVMCMKHINLLNVITAKHVIRPDYTLQKIPSNFWNIVRKSKKNDVQDDVISNSTLTEYFQEKMSSSVNPTDVITEAEVTVRQKYNHLTDL